MMREEGMILRSLIEKKQNGHKSFGVLIDPDKTQSEKSLDQLIRYAIECNVNYFFVGGSLLVSQKLPLVVQKLKSMTTIPVILFPGNNMHIVPNADGILFLSLISGRNPDLLIGQHVAAAPLLKNSGLEILPTGYMLVGNDHSTTVAYISQTLPIPSGKPDIAVCTAMAGEMLGLKLIYLDAGSGAKEPIDPYIISEVRKNISVPLIVGGGLNTIEKARNAFDSGADMIIIGNGVEKSIDLLVQIADKVQELNS